MSTWQTVERWASEATIPSATYDSAVISLLGKRGSGVFGVGGKGNEESSVYPFGPPHALPFSMALQPA